MVVIPAYNEAATIRGLAERVLLQLPRLIVVDDGSGDDTAAALAGLPLTVLRNDTNQGKGYSLWRGMQHALEQGADAVITLDGDGQHAPEDIPALLATADSDGEAVIIAARTRNRENAPRARYFANRFADFWISWAAGQRIVDTQSGFRLYPRSFLQQYQPRLSREAGFVFESEAVIEAVRRGHRCRMVPIDAVYPVGARHSHFRPVTDIARIVRMVAWKLFTRGMFPWGLWRALTGPLLIDEGARRG